MAAARLGYRMHVLTAEADSPAAQVAAGITIGDYDDPEALRAFAGSVDVITFEFENVSAEGLDLLAALGRCIPRRASSASARTGWLRRPSSTAPASRPRPGRAVADHASCTPRSPRLGLPAVLKTTRLGYDGKGQARSRTPERGRRPPSQRLEPKPLILEGFVDFACEISVVVARGADGQVTASTRWRTSIADHILDLTFAPAPHPGGDGGSRRSGIARQVAEALGPGRRCWRWRCSWIATAGCW